MRYFYDQEFLEDGRTIDQISIGIVAEDGREYYAVNSDMNWGRVSQHDWLMVHVVPSLPTRESVVWPYSRILDRDHSTVKTSSQIADEVAAFILPDSDAIELWGWYSAYDHVCLMQLWGPMMSKPPHLPMFTHDLKQEVDRLRLGDLPSMPGVAPHHALSDARELKWRYELLFGTTPMTRLLSSHRPGVNQPRICPTCGTDRWIRWDHKAGAGKCEHKHLVDTDPATGELYNSAKSN